MTTLTRDSSEDSNYRFLKFVPMAIFVVSTIVAAVRLEGRVSVHDQMFVDREKMETQRWEEVKTQLGDIKERLKTIDKKVDDQTAALLAQKTEEEHKSRWSRLNPF